MSTQIIYCLFPVLILLAFRAPANVSNDVHVDSLQKRIEFCSAQSDKACLAEVHNQLGLHFDDAGRYEEANHHYHIALENFTLLLDSAGIANCYLNIGITWSNQGNYSKAVENYLKASAIYERIEDEKGLAGLYNSIANVYSEQGDRDNAIQYYNQSLEISRRNNLRHEIAIVLNNLGIVWQDEGDHAKALEYYLESLKYEEGSGDIPGLADSYNNLGVTYSYLGQHEKALHYYSKSIDLRNSIGNLTGLSLTYVNISETYLDLGKTYEARISAIRSRDIAEQLKAYDDLSNAYYMLSMVDSVEGKWADAYENFKLYKQFNDTVFNSESERVRATLFARYESEKKENQILILKKEKEKQAAIALADQERSQAVITSVAAGLVLLLFFSVFLFKRWQLTRKQKFIIEKQKVLVDEQKMILELKNKDITDSITYARRIQQAKLPAADLIQQHLPESFILFQPKDIVSGDFYFFMNKGNSTFLAAADCTGHGVPGAFMSLISSDKLEEAVLQFDSPAEILRDLNNGIKDSLGKQEQDNMRDGLDISLCRIEREGSTTSITYAGANRPIWFTRNGKEQIIEIKGTKKAIGGFTPKDQTFEEHKIELEKGDGFYLFSDGFADTFGGKNNKKLTTRRLRELVASVSTLPMQEQEKRMSDFLLEWKGDYEQVDDILLMGVRT